MIRVTERQSATRVRAGRVGSYNSALPMQATGRLGTEATTARAGCGAPAFRVSAIGLDAGARGAHGEPQETLSIVRLMVRRRRGRKRALGTRTPITLPTMINQRWSLDFVSDTLSEGRRFRILCIVDDFSRECLATVVDTSLGGVRAWCVNWNGSRSNERSRRWWLAIMERNSPVVRCCAGQPEGSRGTTSSRANRCRTLSSKDLSGISCVSD